MAENTPWEVERMGDDWFNVTDRYGSAVAEAIPTASAANLIASAPEMLALLKLALGDTEYVLSQGFWDQVRAVIAKAEGTAPDRETDK
jgi:hypothetical protein